MASTVNACLDATWVRSHPDPDGIPAIWAPILCAAGSLCCKFQEAASFRQFLERKGAEREGATPHLRTRLDTTGLVN